MARSTQQARNNRLQSARSRLWWRSLATVVLLTPAISPAAETCPWLNAATAGGVIGAPVTATVTHENANREDAACQFIRERDGVSSELRIEVLTMETPRSEFASHAAQCGPDSAPLQAIGNEAVVCIPDEGKSGKRAAQLVGRVRNRIFTVLVSTTDSSTALNVLREKARAVGEQVAGDLF
jgi:hypothetical protein